MLGDTKAGKPIRPWKASCVG